MPNGNSRRAIETFSGAFLDPLDPDPTCILLEDIAHALANQCRFTGHTRRFYSIAEHSYYVAKLLALWGNTSRVVLSGLMHDASEAYLCDVASPLKADLFGDRYRDAENVLMSVIAERFGFFWPPNPIVKEADDVLLWCEADALLPSRAWSWTRYEDFGRELIAQNPEVRGWIANPWGHGCETLWSEDFLACAQDNGVRNG